MAIAFFGVFFLVFAAQSGAGAHTQGYEVHGIVRRSSSFNTGRIEKLYHDRHDSGYKFTLHYGDLTDGTVLLAIVNQVRAR